MQRRLAFVIPGLAVAGVVGALLFASGLVSAQGEIDNPSFETGSTSGWDETIPGGDAYIDVVTDCGGALCASGPFSPYSPVQGNHFALLSADGPSSFTSLSQTFTVPAGSRISGWAFFCDAEGPGEGCVDFFQSGYCDPGVVNVYVEGVLRATPFAVDACSGDSTDWTSWSFAVPGRNCEAVEVTIEAGVANDDDDDVSSLLGFDDVEVDSSNCARGRGGSLPPNIGGVIAFGPPPTPYATRVPTVAPDVAITPPDTGSAGLVDSGSDSGYAVAGVVVAAALAGLATLRLARRLG